jgi:hypothetical protein
MQTKLELNTKCGKWLVLRFDCVDEKRRRRYICRCECGLEQSVVASALAAGRTKSCRKCKADDLTGKEFGRWRVIRRDDNVSRHGHSRWECECTCGKVALVERCNLTNGASQGCWECQRDVLKTSHFPRIWYRKQKEQAKARGRTWALTEEELWQIWEQQNTKCPLTGLVLCISSNPKEMTASLDRKKSEGHYSSDNVWFVHKHVNLMKYRFDLTYFVKMCRLISENSGQ